MVWFEFLICAGLMTYFAYYLCKEGIIISERTHLEEGVIGMFFLAIATSFPEIVTGSTAVFYLGKVGLGYGDIVGSVIVNLMILLALDYYQGKGRILLRVSRISRLTGVFVVFIISVVIIAAVLRLKGMPIPAFKGVGVESVLIVGIYFVCLGIVRKMHSRKHSEIYAASSRPFREIWTKFILLLMAVMFLGVWMARIGEKIVVETDLSQTFTGALLLGVATSLPEIIVSFAALKASSVDMAVGNILGSNLFDVGIIAFLDLLSKRPILGMLTAGQMIATVLVLGLSSIAVLGLFVKRDTKRRISWDTGLIFIVGFAGFVLLYFVR